MIFGAHGRHWLGGLLGVLLAGAGLNGAACAADFELVALGVHGGLSDGNLSSYLVRAPGRPHYLALDAGSVLPGIAAARAQGAFADSQPPADDPLTPAGYVFRQAIRAYFISHAHLDHVEGLLIGATADVGPKPIYGLASTLDVLSTDYFNWQAWPNFADRGAPPTLGRYLLTAESPRQPFAVADTGLSGALYPLTHDRVTSSMILLRHGDVYLAYFGDTGADAVQHSALLGQAWQALAPLLRRHALRAIVIECSYPDDVPDAQLFGHLNPAWLLRELHRLAQAAGGPESLRGLTVLVTHIKPSLLAGRDPSALIAAQLAAGNDLGVRFVYPRQGQRFLLPAPR
ncbi:MAG: 3',5'-cyclic-nucleotide phosphodiesterase [Dyella sp.]